MIRYTSTVFLFFLLLSASAQQSSTAAFPAFKGVLTYIDMFGAARGMTVNVEQVCGTMGSSGTLTARLGFGAYRFEGGRIPYRAVPIGVSLFKGRGKSHSEFGLNLCYVVGSEYTIRPPILGTTYSRSIFFTPSLGYRYMRPGGGFFLRAGYSPNIKLKEYSDDRVYSKEIGQPRHGAYLSLGYYFIKG
jgi:hypothetical protein